MPNVIYTATLDFTDNGVFNAGWRIKQGDFGSSSLNITLSDNGAIVFDDSIEPEIVFKRADGRSVISTMQSAGENSGYYIYNFVGNELAVPGPCIVDVKIVGSDSRTSTASCRFDVIDDTIGYDPTGAGTYNNPVSALAETALSTARQAEAWAVGTKNGSPVSSGDPTYHNNSKYWSELRMGSKIKNTTGQFNTVTGGLMQSCVVDLEPIQNLHGYSKPWTGGSGKNLFPMSVESIKNALGNIGWTRNAKTISGVTFTIITDDGNNVIGIKVNGTASTSIIANLGYFSLNGTYRLLGCPTNGSATTYRLDLRDENAGSVYGTDVGIGVTISTTSRRSICIRIENGYTCNNLTFKPMLTSDLTATYNDFEPYTNICAISGHTQAQVGNVGKNKCDPSMFAQQAGTTLRVRCNLFSVKMNIGDKYTISFSDSSIQATFALSADTQPPDPQRTPSFISGTDSGWQSSGYTYTAIADGWLTIGFRHNGDSAIYIQDVVNAKPQLEKGSTPTTYEPYNGYTTTINLGGTYYGGTLDAVSGKFTVTHGFKTFDGSENGWALYEFSTGLYRAYIAISDIKQTSTDSDVANIVCNRFPTDSYINPTLSSNYITGRAIASQINIFETIQSTLANWRTWLSSNPLQVCYELATPQTIQLTPKNLETLVGQNNLSAPLEGQSFVSAEYRDNMSVVYITDERVVGKWIDGKDIYQRTIDLGSSGVSVPANSSASTGLAKGNVQLPIWSTAISPSGQAFPYIGCSVGSTYIMMENKTGNATTVRYFTFQYTKS